MSPYGLPVLAVHYLPEGRTIAVCGREEGKRYTQDLALVTCANCQTKERRRLKPITVLVHFESRHGGGRSACGLFGAKLGALDDVTCQRCAGSWVIRGKEKPPKPYDYDKRKR